MPNDAVARTPRHWSRPNESLSLVPIVEVIETTSVTRQSSPIVADRPRPVVRPLHVCAREQPFASVAYLDMLTWIGSSTLEIKRTCDGHQRGGTSMSGDGDSSASPNQWPESLDAMIAAPEHHEILLENDRVRVLDTRPGPGVVCCSGPALRENRWHGGTARHRC